MTPFLADPRALRREDGTGEHKHIALDSPRVVPSVLLDLGPCATVVLDVCWMSWGTMLARLKLCAIAVAVGMSPAGAMWPRE